MKQNYKVIHNYKLIEKNEVKLFSKIKCAGYQPPHGVEVNNPIYICTKLNLLKLNNSIVIFLKDTIIIFLIYN